MKSKLKRTFAALSAAAMLIGMIPSGSIAYATATVDVTLTTSNMMVTFTAEDCKSGCNGHIITQNVQSGQLARATIIVESGTHNVTFSGLNLTSANVGVMPSATLNLTLDKTNTIQGNDSGIYVPEGATLTIDGSGSLDVSASSAAAGIGGAFVDPSDPSGYTLGNRNCGTVVINGGNITATGGSYSAGIGGAEADFYTKIPGNGGNITINGGNVTATGGGDDYYGGAGIGGGNYKSKSGSGGTLTINGGNVTLTAGHSTAYGFGSGSGNNSNAGTLTLADASYLTLTSGTTLDPNGTYFITADPTEDMIAVPNGLVYTGNLLDVSDIKIDDSKNGTAEYFGQNFNVNASADGWERSFSPAEVKEAGNYTVTFTKGGKSISKTFTVAECPHTGLEYAQQADGKHGGTCSLCGTEVSEEHKWVDSTCSVCNAKAVAQVEIGSDTTYYDTIGNAWNAVEGKTASITLLANVTAEGIYVVDLGENITFNGGNFTYTSEYGVLSVGGGGQLTINSGTFIATQGVALNAVTGSTITLNGGTFTGGSRGAAVACPNDPVSVFLPQGYAYYQNGQPLEMSDQKYLEGSVTVQKCKHDDSVYTYQPIDNTNTHHKTCRACGYSETAENCTYGNEYQHNNTTHWQTCEICDGTKIEAHNIITVDKKEPTCTENGNSEYWKCNDCDTCFSDENGNNEIPLADTVIKATGHDLTHTERIEATCTEDGNIAYWYCSECKKYFSDKNCETETELSDTVISAKGHTIIKIAAAAAACAKNGNIEYWKCSDCGICYGDENGENEISPDDTVIPANGSHTLTGVAYRYATCTTSGNIPYWYCGGCGKYFSDSSGTSETTWSAIRIPAFGHYYVSGKCRNCGRFEDGVGSLAGASLSLSGNIGVNFFMELDSSVISDKNAYMQFTLPDGNKMQVMVSDAETKQENGNKYYVFHVRFRQKI